MRWILLGVTVAGLVAVAAAPGRAGVILGDAANYGVLVEPGSNSVQTSNGAIVGNIGIGDTTTPKLSNTSGTITGNVDFYNATGTVQNPITGTVSHNVAAVKSALDTMNAYASTWTTEAATVGGAKHVTISIGNNGDQTINASSGVLDAAGNRIFTVDGKFDLNSNSQTHGLTITGSATDYVVINFSSLQNLNGLITFGGGLAGTSDHVFFNYTGTQNFTASSNHHELSGDFLVTNAKFTWNAVTVDGRVIGGADNQDFQMNSGFNLNAPPKTAAVPEPSTLAAALSALLTGFGRRWLRRRRAFA